MRLHAMARHYFDYESKLPCLAKDHSFAMNGSCHTCRRSRKEIIKNALGTIALHGTRLQKNVAETLLEMESDKF